MTSRPLLLSRHALGWNVVFSASVITVLVWIAVLEGWWPAHLRTSTGAAS